MKIVQFEGSTLLIYFHFLVSSLAVQKLAIHVAEGRVENADLSVQGQFLKDSVSNLLRKICLSTATFRKHKTESTNPKMQFFAIEQNKIFRKGQFFSWKLIACLDDRETLGSRLGWRGGGREGGMGVAEQISVPL